MLFCSHTGKAFWEEGTETGGGWVVGAEGRAQRGEEEWSEGTGPERGGEKPQRLRLLLGQNQVAALTPWGVSWETHKALECVKSSWKPSIVFIQHCFTGLFSRLI